MIESFDPITLPLYAVAIYAAAMYPLGIIFGAECSVCCCAKCTGCLCCGNDYARPVGFCCEGEWRESGTGSCCGGVWRSTEDEEGGECCDGVWYTSGTCCKVPTVPLYFTSDFGGVEACNALARGKIILTDGRTTIAAVLQHGGAGYARVVDDVVEVATVTIISLNNLSGTYATLSATIDDDPESETFGQITALTIDSPGGGYEHWFAPPQDHYFSESEGGECCGNDWRTTEGTCCNDAWYPEVDPCPDGQVFVNKSLTCCGCMEDEVYDPVSDQMVPTLDNLALAECPDCGIESFPYSRFAAEGEDRGPIGRCCLPGGVCTYTFEDDCDGTWEDKCCLDAPRCLTTCCREDDDGVVTCEVVPRNECELPSLRSNEPNCDTACRGACCVDGGSIGVMTQEECDDADGCWAGIGQETCRPTDECRPPFSTNCCESVVSSASGLTFTQPRRKRCSPTSRPWLVTVTGTTDSEIMIHGVPVGQTATPAKRCPVGVSFLLCWDSFNIEPMPCDSEFRNLDVSVCWTPAAASPVTYQELLNYSGCGDITLWLGDCSRDCATTLTYAGPGVTVAAPVQILGSATIQANGGAIVFPSAFSYSAGCDITLTLDGTSTADNSVSTLSNPNITNKLSLKKTGSGRWKLVANNTYSGTSEILGGTVVVGVNTPFGGSSGAFGQTNDAIELGRPLLTSGAILLEAGVIFSKQIQIPTSGSPAILGGVNTSGTSTFGVQSKYIFLGRNVTLLCATGGTVKFANLWTDSSGNSDPSASVTIGDADNLGTVRVANTLTTSGAVTVSYGTLYVDNELGYLEAASVTVNGAGATLRYESVSPLTSPVSLVSGTLTGDATINTVAATGGTISVDSGDEIVIGDELSGSGTLAKTGAGTLRISGDSTFAGTLNVSAGEVVVEQITTNPGGLVSAATFSNTTLSVAFTGDPDTGDQFRLLAGATTQSYTPTLTGTTATGTYNSATSTLTIT